MNHYVQAIKRKKEGPNEQEYKNADAVLSLAL